ncbi:P-type ATPase and adenyl cyclase domain-containing protein [Cryptosporidium canis]|nr:P-type ATPase and adenyl cyclase domain-containing protein [Cryptosporidium canis]
MTESFGKSMVVSTEEENINGINKRPVWISRKIILNLSGEVRDANKYPSNNYSGCKYSLFQYISLSLLSRCKRTPILITFLSFIISFFVFSSSHFIWITLSFTVLFTILPPLIMDICLYIKIRMHDYKINSRYCIVFDNDKMEFVVSRWRNLKVGDIVCVLDGEQFPADVVVLQSSGKKAYISSEMVDGSRLVRTCEPTGVQTDLERAIKDFILSPARITCDVPSGDINHFEGSLKWEGKPRAKALTIDNFALMFSRLRFASWVLAIVVYAGTDTRIAIRQHSAIENKNRYNPVTKLESTVSKICFALFLVTAFSGINIFTNKDSNFEAFMNSFLSLSGINERVHRARWHIIAEFAALFNLFVPVTLTAINDIIRIVGIFRFSHNKSAFTEYTSEGLLQKVSNGSKLNIFLSKEQNIAQAPNEIRSKVNTDSKSSSFNELAMKPKNKCVSEPNQKPLEITFNKYDSLNSFGEVDISLIHQNSIMDSQPMWLKFISLNGGQEYNFKRAQKINTSPKFSIISGLLWKHHSISWQKNDTSRFSGGSIRVLRPGRGVSIANLGLITPSKLELFHYFNVLLAISKLGVIRNKDKGVRSDRKTVGQRGRFAGEENQNNKKKIRKYYTKLLFQIKGLKNALVDLPPDPVQIQPRDIWPPLPKVKVNSHLRNKTASLKSMNEFSNMSSLSSENELYLSQVSSFGGCQRSFSSRLHPALPIHLFPKRLIRLLNHIILSNQRKRVALNVGAQCNGSLSSNQEPSFSELDHQAPANGSKDYQVFDTKKIQINKEDNEEILYLLFNNIVKLTRNFYGWGTGRKYRIPNEYSLLVKSLLMESVDYSLATCFKSERDDQQGALRKLSSLTSGSGGSTSNVSEYNEGSERKGSVLIDMLYAMAICNTTVPHLRIVEHSHDSGVIGKVSQSPYRPQQSSVPCHKFGRVKELKKDRSVNGKKINYCHELPREIVKKSIFSFCGSASSNQSNGSSAGVGKSPTSKIPFFAKKTEATRRLKRSSTVSNARRLYMASKSMSLGEGVSSDLIKRPSSGRFIPPSENCYLGRPFRGSRSCGSGSKSADGRRNIRITHRYNNNYEKLHKQRRVGCINSHSREILLTKYYLNYYYNASQLLEESRKTQNEVSSGNRLPDLGKAVGDQTRAKMRREGICPVSINAEYSGCSGISESRLKSKCWKELGKRLRNLNFSYRISDREEKIFKYNESFPRSYVQYSGIDENDLTIVHTAASCGMRLVLVNSQYVVVESLGRTVFSSLIYKNEDKAKQEISMIVKFFQKRDATLYVRGVAEHILPLLNPSLIRSQGVSSESWRCNDQTFSCGSAGQNYEDLMYKIKKLQYQGYRVFIFAKKTISEEELAKMDLRHKLVEHNGGFRFLLDSSAEDYFQKLKTRLEYLGHVGIESRIQENVPKSIRSMLDFGIKPWFLFSASSANSIMMIHKIFPSCGKIPLIRLDRLPLKNRGKATTFLSSLYNELKIIVENNYRVVEGLQLITDKLVQMDDLSENQENVSNGRPYNTFEECGDHFFNDKIKVSNVDFLRAFITISSLNGEVQLSQIGALGLDSSAMGCLENGGGRSSSYGVNEDWLGWTGCVPGHGIINSLPGVVFSASQLNEIFDSRELLNYFFSVALISPFVVISKTAFSDIAIITNYLKSNVLPRPLILGISGNTGNVPVLSSCDVSISVSLSNHDAAHQFTGINIDNYVAMKEKGRRFKERVRLVRLGKLFRTWKTKKKGVSKSSIETSNNYLSEGFTEESNYSLAMSGSEFLELSTERDTYLTSETFRVDQSESGNLRRQPSVSIHNYTIQDIFSNSENSNFVITPVTDVTVSRFEQIIPLLSRVGRLTSFRICFSIFNNVFKLFLLIIPNIIFQFYCEWSGTLIQHLDMISIYLVFWTTLFPFVFGFFGIDVPKYLLDLPYLYSCSRSGYYSHWINYIGTILESLVLGITSFYFSAILSFSSPYKNGINADISVMIAALTMYCILGAFFSFLIKSKSQSTSLILVMVFKACSILLLILVATLKRHSYVYMFSLYGLFTQNSYIFLLTIPLFISYVVHFNLIWKIIIHYSLPDPSTCVKDWWLIHISQASRVLKRPAKLSMRKALRDWSPGQFLQSLLLYLKISLQHEWMIAKNHLLFGRDGQDKYLTLAPFDSMKIPTLTDTFATQYQKYFIWTANEGRSKPQDLAGERRPNATSSPLVEGRREANEAHSVGIQMSLQPQIIHKNISLGKSLESEITIQSPTQNNYSGNAVYRRPLKFFKPAEINYFGDNRVLVENDSFELWKRRGYRIKGIRSLQFAQSLRQFSPKEFDEYNRLILDYAASLADNRVGGLITIPVNDGGLLRAAAKVGSSNNTEVDSSERMTSIVKTGGRNLEGPSNTVISIVPQLSSAYPRIQEASTVDLNINMINSSSSYRTVSTFSEDIKALLNPFKLTFKVGQLELEYQIERQIEAYEHRNALRAVLCVISGIFLNLGPFSVNVSETSYKWVGAFSVIFCSAIFLNFVLSYTYTRNILCIRSQFPLLIIISISSILTSSHGFALAVIYPILSFIIFRLGFIPGVYVTIIAFLSLVAGQFIWGMPSAYWLRYLPILIGINTFCGFLGYRSELLYRAQFLLETHTNDLRQRQRQILDTMLPSFIVERLLIDQKNNPRFSSESVEDRGTVSILFCDIYDFHNIVALLQPKKLISLLDQFFLALDCLIDDYSCTKIETVFETYLVASCLDPYDEEATAQEGLSSSKCRDGFVRPRSRRPVISKPLRDIINLLRFALQMHKIGSSFFYEVPPNKNFDLFQLETDGPIGGPGILTNGPCSYPAKDRKAHLSSSFISTGQEMILKQLKLKIGIHSGRVISGVVGTNKPQYALFGDTVNTASRMKSSCETGKIQVTSMTYNLIKDISILKWKEKRSFVKGKGMMDTYTLESVSGSAYPAYTYVKKQQIRGKGVGAIQVGNFYIKNASDFDILLQDDVLLKYLHKSTQEEEGPLSGLSPPPHTSKLGDPAPPGSPPSLESIPEEKVVKETRFTHEQIPSVLESVTVDKEYREEVEYDREDSPPPLEPFLQITESDGVSDDDRLGKPRGPRFGRLASSSFRFLKRRERGLGVGWAQYSGDSPSRAQSSHENRTLDKKARGEEGDGRGERGGGGRRRRRGRRREGVRRRVRVGEGVGGRPRKGSVSASDPTSSSRPGQISDRGLYNSGQSTGADRWKKEKISDLMNLTLGFKDNEIEQKYLITYYSDLTTLKTIEESLVIVIVTLVLQTLIYTVLPCGESYEGKSGFRILWTVRIIYISSVFLSWLVLFSTYTNHQVQDSADSVIGAEGVPRSPVSRGGIGMESRILSRNLWGGQISLENTKHVGGPILFLNGVLAGGASMLMLTILWQYTTVDSSISLWCDEEILELLLLATVHHNAGLLFKYIVLFDLLIMFLLLTIFLVGINVNLEGIVVYYVTLLVNIIAAYSREKTGRAIFYGTLVAGNCEQKAEELLVAMLPRKVLIDFQEDRLKLAYIHKNVTFLFSDICGFTQWAMSVEAESVVYMLSSLYAQFDDSLSKFGLFKLFTIGDAYVAMSEPEIDPLEDKSRPACLQKASKRLRELQGGASLGSGASTLGIGLGMSQNHSSSSSNFLSHNPSVRSSSPSVLSSSTSNRSPAQSSYVDIKDQRTYNLNMSQMEGYSPAEGARRSIAMAHDMLQKIAYVREKLSLPELNMRIGLHYGGCIGGIVGSSRLRYEVWGHDVIIGNRMESCGTPGNITISGQLHEVLSKNFSHLFKFNYIGKVSIRKQHIDMYRTRIRRNVQLEINKVSNSENVSNLIKWNILHNNERQMEI